MSEHTVDGAARTVNIRGLIASCPTCGKPFKVSSKRRRFCSKQCNRAGPPKKFRPERRCLRCGTSFQPTSRAPHKIYCSLACGSKAGGASSKGKRLTHRVREWEICGDGSARYQLPCGRYVIIDAADIPLVNHSAWFSKKSVNTYYARRHRSARDQRYFLHRFILPDVSLGIEIDHRDGDGLNCRRSNLRYATRGQNVLNSVKGKQNATSRLKGVSRVGNYWKASFKRRSIGLYADERSAGIAWDREARRKYGEFARLNFPDADPNESLAVYIRPIPTHCRYGHPYTLENTYRRPDTGARMCRQCIRRRKGRKA